MKADRFTVPISIVMAGGAPIAFHIFKLSRIHGALLACAIVIFIALAYRKSGNPLLVCCGALAFEHCIVRAVGLACAWGRLSPIGSLLIINYAFAVSVIAFLCCRNACASAGFNGPRRWSSLHLIIVPVIVVMFAQMISPALRRWNLGFPLVFIRIKGSLFVSRPLLLTVIALVGIFSAVAEEGLYRGIVLNALRGYRIIWRVLISSFFFSMVHLSYHVNGGYAVSSATISTMLSGICSAALRIVTGTLWAPIVMHALHNFLAFSRCTDSQLLVSRRGPVSLYGLVANIAWALSLALYGFWILRRMRLSKCRGDQGRLNHPRTSMTG